MTSKSVRDSEPAIKEYGEKVDVFSTMSHNEKAQAEGGLPEGDYSGASAKTDPAEIALVRKLDYRIMVSPRLHSL